MLKVERVQDTLVVAGELTRSSIENWLASKAKLSVPGALAVDLAQISRLDTAGLALLLDWAQQAAKPAKLSVMNMPESGARLLALFQLQAILPLHS